ncbi:MAG: ABC transporter ATP-binding protein [Erysipelotrichaceae bacterium]|nr:ABC transporter ATP-binding protein [Erysipelotrichaceae bacterium]MBQ2078590.1 ABC transporter ATP-binding protein [Erysipelotrichaceae bacterium]MBQ2138291.1 ABC transporter ATP-binding protein [Erysipelotrichaceae bacterium]
MIQINGLKKKYKDFTLDLTLDLPKGRVSGLVGKNGAGKSTTLKAILGLIQTDEGSVKVFGKDAFNLTSEEKQQLGVALSDSSFSGYLTVDAVKNILKNMYHSFDEEKFLDLSEKMKLPLNKQIKEFSTGMKAKLKVIAALCHKAKLLIMDEPTSGLDVEARNEVLDILREYLAQDDEVSLLISSHISSDLEGLCDDIYLIDEGRLLLHEQTDELLDKYGVIKADDESFEKLEKDHILAYKKEKFGYSLFTDEKEYYRENYPDLIIENGNIDDLILIMTGGKKK